MDDQNPLAFRRYQQNLEKTSHEKNLKKSRILVACLAGGTFFISFLLWFTNKLSQQNLQIKSPQVNLPQIGDNLEKIHLVFPESKKTKTPEELKKILFPIIQPELENWGIWVATLDSSFNFQYQAETIFPAASLIKLPIVARFYQEIERGNFTLEQTWTLKQADKIEGNGSLQYQPAGEKITFEQLAFLSLNQSDNTAFNIICKNLGQERIKQTIRDLGMKQTSFENNETTPKDIALFFQKLYQGEILSPQLQEKFFQGITNTIFEEQIPAGIPKGIRVAHKVGFEERSAADSGIVFVPENPFILVFLSKNTNPEEAKKIIPKLAEETYWFLIN
jgi:beta-lactamase class A